MRKKDLNVRKKVKKKFKPISNLKIKKIYKKFKRSTLQNIGKDSFAIGVSGGPDSLCLAYLSKIYKSEFGNELHTLIVDHKIRNESSAEALKVKNILKKNNIKSEILSWRGESPRNNIQFKARKIRYDLIYNYCLKNNVKYLITAHHQDDQIENFFIRLSRGSGLTGLSSMPEVSNYNDDLKIVRPFLNTSKKELKFVTEYYFGEYIKDPSNENENFLRIRIRKYIKNLEKEGLDDKKIIKTINNLLVAKNALNFYKEKALRSNINFLSKSKCLINLRLFEEEADEIVFKSVSDVLSLVSGSYYPPRSKKILNLIKRLKYENFKKCTLGGCLLEKKDGFILVSREARIKQISPRA